MKQRILITLSVAVVALVAASVAIAGNTIGATATVSAGLLSASTTSAPSSSVTLNGTDQTITLPVSILVNDFTGSGTGWNLTEGATQFTTGGASPHLLSYPSAATVTAACSGIGTCTAPTNSVTGYPLLLSSTVKVFNAAANTGMGQFNLTGNLTVAVPGNAYAGSYTSTVTVASVSGP